MWQHHQSTLHACDIFFRMVTILLKRLYQHHQTLFTLTFQHQRPSSEEARPVLLVLSTTKTRRGKKLVMCGSAHNWPRPGSQNVVPLSKCVLLLLSILYFLSDCLSNCRLVSVDHMVIMSCVLSQLHTEAHVWPIYCHVTSLPWQELEEALDKLLLPSFSTLQYYGTNLPQNY